MILLIYKSVFSKLLLLKKQEFEIPCINFKNHGEFVTFVMHLFFVFAPAIPQR